MRTYLAPIGVPQAYLLLSIFLETDHFPDYVTRIVTRKYGGTNDQSNALGFDETQNIIEGQVLEYIWDANSIFSKVILSTDIFFDDIVRKSIQNLEIDKYYDMNPGINSKSFTMLITDVITLEGLNLGSALKKCTINFDLTVFTERGWGTKPQITGISGSGYCWDFYDFRSHGQDDDNGWAGRLQACHVQGIRDIGEVYAIHINLDVPETHFWIDAYYDDLDYLKRKWNDIVNY